MNPHNHPPKIKSIAMDQLPTPRTDAVSFRVGRNQLHPSTVVVGVNDAKTLERELLASQARERVLRSALENLADAVGNSRVPQNTMQAALQIHVTLGPALEGARAALNHP